MQSPKSVPVSDLLQTPQGNEFALLVPERLLLLTLQTLRQAAAMHR